VGDDLFTVGDERIALGESRDVFLPVTQSYSGASVALPLRVMRAPAPGPALLLTAAVHGDELNGTGIIRELLLEPPFELVAGTLVLVPVVNVLGFERHSRYLPDRRDLNRSFPGSKDGSLTSRFAHVVFHRLVSRCDYGIDFHTAALRRTNFPHVRGDLRHPEVKRLARAFGCELVIDAEGPKGSLRRSACEHGHPTILLEAGEVWKIEPSVLELGVRGVGNVLLELGMIRGRATRPPYQARVERSHWVRADAGGLLRFFVAPGDVVEAGQPLASCVTLLGREQGVCHAPEAGVVMGLTTLPVVKPGDPVCHLAYPRRGIEPIRRALRRAAEGLHDRLRDDLATSVAVDEPEDDDWA